MPHPATQAQSRSLLRPDATPLSARRAIRLTTSRKPRRNPGKHMHKYAYTLTDKRISTHANFTRAAYLRTKAHSGANTPIFNVFGISLTINRLRKNTPQPPPHGNAKRYVPHGGKASSAPSDGRFSTAEKAVRQHETAFSAPRTPADGTSERLKRARKRLFRVPQRHFPRNAVSISQICFVVFFYYENVYLCVLCMYKDTSVKDIQIQHE